MIYSMYSKYYDALNTGYQKWLFPLLWNEINDKRGGRLLELGCGTGNILSEFKNDFSIVGVDISPYMLEKARAKLPDAELHLSDMTCYKSDEKFDVILCIFDSMNHVLDMEKWDDVLKNSRDNMNKSGIFIFDINTKARLDNIARRPPLFTEFDGNYFYMQVRHKNEKNFVFDVRVLKKVGNSAFEEEREEIEETSIQGQAMLEKAKKYFNNVKVINENGEEITESKYEENEKYRWFFICTN